MHRRTLLVALSAPSLASAADKAVAFAGGRIEVVLPSFARVTSNQQKTLIAVFGSNEDHKLELTLHEELMSATAPDAAEQFVSVQAQKRGKRLQRIPGKALFLDPGSDFAEGEKTFRTLHVQVGFGKALVVITVTAPVTQPMSPALGEFLGKPVNAMIASLRQREV